MFFIVFFFGDSRRRVCFRFFGVYIYVIVVAFVMSGIGREVVRVFVCLIWGLLSLV